MSVGHFRDLAAAAAIEAPVFAEGEREDGWLMDDEDPADEVDAAGAWAILIVDDDLEIHQVTRMVLADLRFAGRRVRFFSAYSGAQARRLLGEHPEIALVLLDVVMEEEAAGLALVRHIREELHDDLMRIILRTGQPGRAPEREVILYYDIDDYRDKAEFTAQQLFTAVVSALRAYQLIEQLERTNRDLELLVEERTAALRKAYEELQRHRDQIAREHELAKTVFAKVVEPGALDQPNLRHLLAPLDVTNGDLLLAARRPDGGQLVMLGDFTGHGLPAALGALPVAELFYRHARRAAPLTELIAEINDTLRAKLPTGLFLAAVLVEIERDMSVARLWNGGVPDAYWYGADARTKARLASTDLPLGVVGSALMSLEVATLDVRPGDRLLVYSDGVIEAPDRAGEQFGQARLEAVLDAASAAGQVFDALCAALREFRGGGPQADDITLMELCFDPALFSAVE